MRRCKRTQVLARAGVSVVLFSGGMLAIAPEARGNLTIVPTWDTTITSDPNAATIEATINTAISNLESDLLNPITVNITFAEMSSGLGESDTFTSTLSYSTYRSSLVSAQTLSADDNLAIASLPSQTGNPVNGNSTVKMTLPLLRALGFNANPPAGDPDSTISFNASIVNDSRPGTNSSDYDLQSVVTHEMDEALGIGGAGSQLNNVLAGSNTLTGVVGPLDLFRYSAAATRSYTTSSTAVSYFSINSGTTDFVNFNQDNNGSDYADWGDGVTPADGKPTNPPQVQDAFSHPGTAAADEPNLGSNELAALDVVGWNLSASALSLEADVLTWDNAGGGGDGLHWDTTNKNWNNGTSETTFTNLSSSVIFNDTNNGHYGVMLNTTVTPASVMVNSTGNYTISGTGSIAGFGSFTKSGTGTVTISTSNTFSGGIFVNSGTMLVAAATAIPSASAVSVAGGTMKLADNITAGTPFGTSNVVLSSLSLSGTGTLDIGNNRVIIDYTAGHDPISSVAAWIANGFNDNNTPESAPAIISSDVATDDSSSGLSYGIGYVDGADGAVAGLPSGEIEIMFTLLGDANLDGTVNAEDYTPFSHNIGQSGMMWDDGDFNYDGTVNSEDYTPFSHNIGQSASLAAAAGTLVPANGIANVPEPVGVMGVWVLGVLGRRRRRRR
jgi:autotransporter-associated beta strand protein